MTHEQNQHLVGHGMEVEAAADGSSAFRYRGDEQPNPKQTHRLHSSSNHSRGVAYRGGGEEERGKNMGKKMRAELQLTVSVSVLNPRISSHRKADWPRNSGTEQHHLSQLNFREFQCRIPVFRRCRQRPVCTHHGETRRQTSSSARRQEGRVGTDITCQF